SSVESTAHLSVESVELFSGDVTKLSDELDTTATDDLVMIACHNDAEMKRLGEVLAAGKLAQSDRLRLVLGHVHAGFRMVLENAACGLALGSDHANAKPQAAIPVGIVVLGDHELFHRE